MSLEVNNDIIQELHEALKENSYKMQDCVDNNITGEPIFNCEVFTAKEDMSKLLSMRKRLSLRKFRQKVKPVSRAVSFCLIRCISLTETLSPDEEEVNKCLRLTLLSLCKVQRLWRALLRYKIFSFMGIPKYHSMAYLFKENENSSSLFNDKDVQKLLNNSRRCVHFLFRDKPAEATLENDTHQKCVDWIVNGPAENVTNAMDYISVQLRFPSFQQYRKYSRPKTYAKLKYRFVRNLYLAIEAIWSAKSWYVRQKDGRQDHLLSGLRHICHATCAVKCLFDKLE